MPRDPESETVLVAARRLAEALNEAGAGARLVFLDARRPDCDHPEGQLRQAGRVVRGFLARLAQEEAGRTIPWQSGGDRSAANELVELADGLWAGVLANCSRLDPAWEVEKAKAENNTRLAVHHEQQLAELEKTLKEYEAAAKGK